MIDGIEEGFLLGREREINLCLEAGRIHSSALAAIPDISRMASASMRNAWPAAGTPIGFRSYIKQ